MKYVYLFLLIAVSSVHLFDSWRDDSKRRAKTKPFILPLIILYYLACTSSPSVLLIAALATSWLGDVLLIPKGNGWFTAGGISFMLTHFLFIAVYAVRLDFSLVKWWAVIPAAVIYYSVSAVIIYLLKPTTPKKMQIPMYVYLLSNSTMNVFSLMRLVSEPGLATAVAYAGALLFFVSDCTLFLVRYYKKDNIIFKKHFTVMLTYILGEFLITQGLLLMG